MSFEDWDIIENDLINRQKAVLQSRRDRVTARRPGSRRSAMVRFPEQRTHEQEISIILIGIVVLGALAAGLWWWKQAGNSSPAYREESVTRGRIEVTVQSTGIVQPRNRLEVKPPRPDALKIISAGRQTVKKGQILL